jgi:hypothetical protein
MCYQPDAPARLLRGVEMLPRIENELALFPDWLSGLRKVKTLRAIDSFACTYWFYAQLYAIGAKGVPAPERTVFQAFREVEARHKKWLKDRRVA